MEYLEDRIRGLEDEISSLSLLVYSLVKIIKPSHTKECFVLKTLPKLGSIEFTNSINLYCGSCKNKNKHHSRCYNFLSRNVDRDFCDCGYTKAMVLISNRLY